MFGSNMFSPQECYSADNRAAQIPDHYFAFVGFQYLDETADNLDGLPYKLHDFGFRGSTSVEVTL